MNDGAINYSALCAQERRGGIADHYHAGRRCHSLFCKSPTRGRAFHTIIKKIKDTPNAYGEPFGRFLPHDAVDEHDKCMKAFTDGIYDMDRIDDQKIIMAHHAPCAQSVHPRFTGDLLNYAYFTELSNEMLDNETIKYWLHGHMHDNWDYNVGQCRVLCNPRGYAGYQLNGGFDVDCNIEI